MRIKVVFTGKSSPEAQDKVQEAINSLGNVEVKLLSDSGMRVIIGYVEKKIDKELTVKPKGVIIKEKKETKRRR